MPKSTLEYCTVATFKGYFHDDKVQNSVSIRILMGSFTYQVVYIFIAVSETRMFMFSNTATIRIMRNYAGYKSCTLYNVARSARISELHEVHYRVQFTALVYRWLAQHRETMTSDTPQNRTRSFSTDNNKSRR